MYRVRRIKIKCGVEDAGRDNEDAHAHIGYVFMAMSMGFSAVPARVMCLLAVPVMSMGIGMDEAFVTAEMRMPFSNHRGSASASASTNHPIHPGTAAP